MNKRITSLLLAVVMICSMLATAVPVFAAPGDSGVSASVTEASPGDTFTVTLTVPGTEKQISDIGVKVHFDSTVFEVTEYTIPSIAGMAKMQSNVAEANSNAFFSATYDSDSSDADITFTGLQLTATFKVKEGAAAGTYAFELDSTCKVGSLTDMGLPDILVKYEDFTSKSVSVTVTVPHTHVYDQTSTDAAHLKTPATCTEAAVYYKSCTCGENGEETFTSGSTLGHDYTKEVENNTYLKTAASNCTEYNVYWYACSRCDANAKDDAEATDKYYTSTTAGAHTEGTEWKFDENKHWHICTVAGCGVVIESSKEAHTPDHPGHATEEYAIKCTKCDYVIEAQLGHTHVFDKEVATDDYKATDATCTAKATYYKSCACGEKGTATFEYGELAAHNPASGWTSDASGHWHACQTANCTEKCDFASHTPDHTGHATEEYAIKCTKCGYVIEAQLDHTHVFDKEVATDVYKATDATCMAKATYYKSCACGAKGTTTFEYGELGAHNWTPATCTVPKTCSVCQATEGDPLGHTEGNEWKYDSDNHWHTCTVEGCGVVIESSKEAHTPDRAEATVNDPIKCSVCGYEIEAQLVAVTNIAATITAPVLGATPDYTPTYVSTPSGGVQFGEVTWYKIKKEDYTGTYEDNWTEMASDETFTTEYYYSADMFFRPEDGYGISEDVTGTVNGKAHVDTYGSVYGEDPNGGDYAYLCIEFGPLHDADTEHFESDADNHWNNCANCDEKQNIAPHAFEWIIDKEATATEKGSKHEECTVCGYAKASVDIPATGTEKTENPDTGDANNMLLWGALLLAGGLGVTGTAAYSKKRREDAE